MLVYTGIDEAGYGPLLGPLCVGSATFVLSHDDPARGAPNLWERLDDVICRGRKDRRRRIAVDDSKRLKGPNRGSKQHPLAHLERGLLAFLGADGDMPDTDAGLLERVGVAEPRQPWYGTTTEIPLAWDAPQLGIDASRLRRGLQRSGIEIADLTAEAIDAEDFNRELERVGRKSTINFGAVLRRIEAVWSRWPTDHPRILIDRQGGRTHYREELQMAFPESRIQVLAESEALSRYRLDRSGSQITVSFLKEAESHHLPVALASMLAKYVRELLMLRLNRFFVGRMATLRPTAGYVQDGRRYVQEIEPLMSELSIRRDALVRRA